MKTFNQVEDQMINEVVVAMVSGDSEAGDKFAEVVGKKMKRKAMKSFAGKTSKEDLEQDFMLKALEVAYKYNPESGNFMPILYKSIDHMLYDMNDYAHAQKRAKTFTVGDETFSREVSFQAQVGEDGETTMADKIADTQKSVEDQVIDRLNEKTVDSIVKEFVASTKGRNGKIVGLVYKANKNDWENEELNQAIAKVLFDEKGVEPKPEAIRKAKSRAMKSMQEAILDGKVMLCNQLEWDF